MVVRRATEHQDATACGVFCDELLPFGVVRRLVCKAHVPARITETAVEVEVHERAKLTGFGGRQRHTGAGDLR
jgi:hypothetical protein